jgi:hypothetical protein
VRDALRRRSARREVIYRCGLVAALIAMAAAVAMSILAGG